MPKGPASGIATKIAERDGILSAEGRTDWVVASEQELEKLLEQGTLEVVKEHRQKKRFALVEWLGRQWRA